MNLTLTIIVSIIVSAAITEIRCRLQINIIGEMADEMFGTLKKTMNDLLDEIKK